MANIQIATFGGGCFWCIETAFNQVKGVLTAISGYSAGKLPNPSYQDVTSGKSGHAEVVQVQFDADVISYDALLDMFFQLHDPTQLNRQGNDIGTQYRSIILCHSTEQEQLAHNKIEELDSKNIWLDKIVTLVDKANTFYRAEEYHQGYVANNMQQPYCNFVILPKLEKFTHQFRHYLKSENDTK